MRNCIIEWVKQHKLNEVDADEDLESVHTLLVARREELEAGKAARTHRGRITDRSHCHHRFAIFAFPALHPD